MKRADLAFSKLAARRNMDLAFVAALVRHKMIRPSIAEVTDPALKASLVEAWNICRRRATELALADTPVVLLNGARQTGKTAGQPGLRLT